MLVFNLTIENALPITSSSITSLVALFIYHEILNWLITSQTSYQESNCSLIFNLKMDNSVSASFSLASLIGFLLFHKVFIWLLTKIQNFYSNLQKFLLDRIRTFYSNFKKFLQSQPDRIKTSYSNSRKFLQSQLDRIKASYSGLKKYFQSQIQIVYSILCRFFQSQLDRSQTFYSGLQKFLQSKLVFRNSKSKVRNSKMIVKLCHNDQMQLLNGDLEIVMKRLGICCPAPIDWMFYKRLDMDGFSTLFDQSEPSLREVKEAFDVFDQNRDGFIDGGDLQRILNSLGFRESCDFEECERMIRVFDENGDGRIDFNEFVKFMENSF